MKKAVFPHRHAVRIPGSAVLMRVQFIVGFRAFSSVVLQFSLLQIFLNDSKVDVLHAKVNKTKLHPEFPAAYLAAKAQKFSLKSLSEQVTFVAL